MPPAWIHTRGRWCSPAQRARARRVVGEARCGRWRPETADPMRRLEEECHRRCVCRGSSERREQRRPSSSGRALPQTRVAGYALPAALCPDAAVGPLRLLRAKVCVFPLEDAYLRFAWSRTQNASLLWVIRWSGFFLRKNTVHHAFCIWVSLLETV